MKRLFFRGNNTANVTEQQQQNYYYYMSNVAAQAKLVNRHVITFTSEKRRRQEKRGRFGRTWAPRALGILGSEHELGDAGAVIHEQPPYNAPDTPAGGRYSWRDLDWPH